MNSKDFEINNFIINGSKEMQYFVFDFAATITVQSYWVANRKLLFGKFLWKQRSEGGGGGGGDSLRIER